MYWVQLLGRLAVSMTAVRLMPFIAVYALCLQDTGVYQTNRSSLSAHLDILYDAGFANHRQCLLPTATHDQDTASVKLPVVSLEPFVLVRLWKLSKDHSHVQSMSKCSNRK